MGPRLDADGRPGLARLRYWWGFGFEFAWRDGKFTATRRDGQGVLIAGTWGTLKFDIENDWAERPGAPEVWEDE
jgi:hypothetical protein